ncbi:hypothetical protein KIN20_022581 [Parelaphostrongylus tenuis]|uniref:Conserved oligomeric Golgi complex subunit 8 n=1 Tax=Parelaphostrongylus tenuis TaxID=148309 RepID=A0AAD5QVA3_PARTN|nr:hypothetical protein KIN20_022581 [Parelaphostrongylus tenuis]
MDVCIRAGYYEAAYSLTNYGMVLQQHSIIKNPLVKGIADKLVEARSFLLEELFNKFSGPLDLASSIQVVNNVRKMPNLTSTQLRICILQHRDMYLNRQILDITNHPEFPIRAIEIYRDCMYDTLVLYLAVFPENESPRKDPSLDPRWETWPSSAPSVLLGQWTARNITRLLDLIRRADMKSGVDMCTIWSKLMSLAASLGRMGLDFRALVVDSLSKMVLERFQSSVRAATNIFLNDTKVLSVVSEDISSLSVDREIPANGPPAPPPEISMWDDICIYGNGILDALNDLRYSPCPMLIENVVSCMRDSLKSVLSWLLRNTSSPHLAKAVEIFCIYFGPFIGRCIRFVFPFSSITRLFGTSISPQAYESLTDLNMTELVASCDGSERIQEVLRLHSSERLLFEVESPTLAQKERSSEPVENVDQKDAVAESSEMCSQPEATSSRVHFELCEESTEEKTESGVPISLVDNKEDCLHDQVQLQVSDAAIAIDTEDDVPALVDTAPSPLYSDFEAGTIHENSWESEQQKSEDDYKSKKD